MKQHFPMEEVTRKNLMVNANRVFIVNLLLTSYPLAEEMPIKLAFEVCKQLFSLNCPVFTSSHNTYLMTNDLLRPDCNFIVSDNKIKPLNESTDKELRFGHNIEKLFRGDGWSGG